MISKYVVRRETKNKRANEKIHERIQKKINPEVYVKKYLGITMKCLRKLYHVLFKNLLRFKKSNTSRYSRSSEYYLPFACAFTYFVIYFLC